MLKNRESFIIREVSGDYYLLHISDNVPFEQTVKMNESAAFIVGELISGKTFMEIAETISKEADIPVEEILVDIKSVVNSMPEYFECSESE